MPHSHSKSFYGSPVPSGLQLNSLADIPVSERTSSPLEPGPPLPALHSQLTAKTRWTTGPDSASHSSHLLPPASLPSDDPHLSNCLGRCFSGSHHGAGMLICFPPAGGPGNQGRRILPDRAYFARQSSEASPDPVRAQFPPRPPVAALDFLSQLHSNSPTLLRARWGSEHLILRSPASSNLRTGTGQKPREVVRSGVVAELGLGPGHPDSCSSALLICCRVPLSPLHSYGRLGSVWTVSKLGMQLTPEKLHPWWEQSATTR